ncbi:MAG: hypothetical protein SGJ16_13950, partial [Nitrospirota bacterium]|nr:hypothetical protein [Nitrospirota bacterium]
VSATRPRDSYLCTDQRVGVKELERWPNNWGQVSVFVAITVLLGRLLLGTGQMAPRTFDLSLKGIIHDRNSGLLGHRGGGSRF